MLNSSTLSIEMKNTLAILSHHKTYTVHFVKNENELLQELSNLNNIVTVIDRKITALYPKITAEIRSLGAVYEMDALEQNKTLAGVEDILKFFQSANVNRKTTVLVIGGGILEDVVSFAAHIFYRGLNVILVPTTLLAMCDTCVGGKCGVNFNGYKNQLGAFHPPEKIYIWPGFLASLTDADVRSGYGEILKYALLNGNEQYEKLKQHLFNEKWFNEKCIDYIHDGLITKKQLVEQDEFDTGMRALLNYGHTFGHAIERATHNAIPHGVAVTKGIDIANYIAWQLGILSQDIYIDIHSLIQKHFDCQLNSDISAKILVENTRKDKKNLNGKSNFVLMEDFGKFKIVPVMINNALILMVNNYLHG